MLKFLQEEWELWVWIKVFFFSCFYSLKNLKNYNNLNCISDEETEAHKKSRE